MPCFALEALFVHLSSDSDETVSEWCELSDIYFLIWVPVRVSGKVINHFQSPDGLLRQVRGSRFRKSLLSSIPFVFAYCLKRSNAPTISTCAASGSSWRNMASRSSRPPPPASGGKRT